MTEGFRRQDPPAVPQLAVPVTVTTEAQNRASSNFNDFKQAIADLICIAFFFLLRVGEYTFPRPIKRRGVWVKKSRTNQIRIQDVGFEKDGQQLPRNSTLPELLQATSVTIKLTQQKNKRMGETIHQRAVPSVNCPVKAMARRVNHILSNKGDPKQLICDVYIPSQKKFASVQSDDIIKEVRNCVSSLQLHKQNIDPDLVGAHSLRAGGAMALKLHGEDATTIQKAGRWKSDTFLMYIHNQIAHLSKDLSLKMSIPLPFVNIGAIEHAP